MTKRLFSLCRNILSVNKECAFFVFGLSFFIFGFSSIYAQQRPILYAGLEYYRHSAYKNNAFYNFNLGAQVYQWKFLAPEVGVELYKGVLEDQNFPNPNAGAVGEYLLRKDFSGVLFSAAPKLKFGKEDIFLTFSPKYNIGKVFASADYFVQESAQSDLVFEAQKKSSAPVSFWSFSVAVEGFLVKTDNYWLSLSLNYTLLNAKKAFEKLDFSEYDIPVSYSNTNSIGLSLRFYWDVFYKD